MSTKLLSEINPPGFSCVICVRISRMWEFYGSKDDEGLKHPDLVVIDEKNNAMYMEIPAETALVLRNKLEEGKVVIMRKFLVEKARDIYKVVSGAYMIKLNRRTEIIPVDPEPPAFPKYVFTLTPFEDLEQHKNKTHKFLDVIGQISAVSIAVKVHTKAGKTKMKRIIKLKNLRLPEQEIQPVQHIELKDDEGTHQTIQKTLDELRDLDPFENLGQTFECTVTVTKLCEGETWYYPACRLCYSRFLTNRFSFKCTTDNCKSTTFDNTDGTSELEFVVFDQRAQFLIGKPISELEKKYGIFEIPLEVQALVGQTFTFIVRISAKRSIENPTPSFEIIRTKKTHGKQLDAPPFQVPRENNSSKGESSIKINRRPLIPIKSNQIAEENTSKTFIQNDSQLDPMGY